MADTIITNTRDRATGSGAEWIVGLLVAAALIILAIALYRGGVFSGAPATDTANINVSVPTSALPGEGGEGGGAQSE